jgi:hypothetical protein
MVKTYYIGLFLMSQMHKFLGWTHKIILNPYANWKIPTKWIQISETNFLSFFSFK